MLLGLYLRAYLRLWDALDMPPAVWIVATALGVVLGRALVPPWT